MRVTVRFAEPEDALALQVLTAPAFGARVLDWEGADTRGWLVAADGDGLIVGALHVLLGRPVGRLEMLALSDSLNGRSSHTVMRLLIDAGFAVLADTGSRIISAQVADENKGMRRFLKKNYGFEFAQRLNTYVAGLT